jgi:hypothetical protein
LILLLVLWMNRAFSSSVGWDLFLPSFIPLHGFTFQEKFPRSPILLRAAYSKKLSLYSWYSFGLVFHISYFHFFIPMELPPKPSRISGLLWGLFSGTAMLSAFILPVHIYALMKGYQMNLESWYFKLYFIALFGSALYHGFYRLKTILKDLAITK